MISTTPGSGAAKPEVTAETRQIVLKEIGAKWGKFSEQDLSALKGNDDLVGQVVAKYGLEKAQAQRDVDALLKGRHI
jgi:uncharacterized protein YjbJ (UPF0337 family)